jgi:uracil-DNA glycosylase
MLCAIEMEWEIYMINRHLHCNKTCSDTNTDYIFPKVTINPEFINIILISEAPPVVRDDYYYKSPTGAFFQTTQTAFKDAGIEIQQYEDISQLCIYLTTAIKCSKKDYLVSADTIKSCSYILENEINQFPNVKAVLCMGDFAIKAINNISKRKYKVNAISAGSTYKIRTNIHLLQGIRYFPSYTQTGNSFNIEKSKRKMIAEDIRSALEYVKEHMV